MRHCLDALILLLVAGILFGCGFLAGEAVGARGERLRQASQR